MTTKKGVDISGANGDVDFAMLKRNGISFVMINLGNRFAENVSKAEAVGMPWGAYYYTYSLSADEDRQELDKILSRLQGKRPTYPIAIDVEDSDDYKKVRGGWNYENVTRNAKFLLEGLAKAGYYPMIYTGFEEIENYLDKAVWQKYDMWWAQWATKCGYPGDNIGMWQFGGEYNAICSPFIEGEIFDQNYCNKDYPSIIKSGGYNGWSAAEKPPTAGITAKRAMDAACSLIGKDEKPNECDIMAWYGGFDTDVNAVACCCAGMMYLFFKKLNAGNLIPGGKCADCGTLALNFYRAGQLHKPADVRPGDLVIFSWSHEKTSVSPLDSLGFMCFEHVELCLEVRDDTILSIGANNGGTECDDFQIKTRRLTDISACCRPKYADGESEPDVSETVAAGNEAVREVQQWLNSRYHVNIDTDGIYGAQTRKALTKALQTELNEQFGAGLAVDGIYGSQTKAAVRNISGGVFSNYIKVLQGFLICNGYDTGGLDGVFGNATDRAVRQYQRDNSLTVDGIAGRETFGALCG